MNNNGAGQVPIIGRQPRIEFDNTETMHRRIGQSVIETIKQNNGNMPMADPAGYLLAIVALDKIDELSKRLATIEDRLLHLIKVVERKPGND